MDAQAVLDRMVGGVHPAVKHMAQQHKFNQAVQSIGRGGARSSMSAYM